MRSTQLFGVSSEDAEAPRLLHLIRWFRASLPQKDKGWVPETYRPCLTCASQEHREENEYTSRYELTTATHPK
jgi:hypothetical protein